MLFLAMNRSARIAGSYICECEGASRHKPRRSDVRPSGLQEWWRQCVTISPKRLNVSLRPIQQLGTAGSTHGVPDKLPEVAPLL